MLRTVRIHSKDCNDYSTLSNNRYYYMTMDTTSNNATIPWESTDNVLLTGSTGPQLVIGSLRIEDS